MNQIFGTMSTLELFVKERKLFLHENANGFYRVSVYFLAKVTCDILPLRLMPVVVYSCILYFMVGECHLMLHEQNKVQIDLNKTYTISLQVA